MGNVQTRMEELGSLWSDVGFSEDKDFGKSSSSLNNEMDYFV